ncbi:hypothetical protein QR680_004780 [Steinernema hermaphroditum]|uniref:NADH-cytochrome b5 reductase n=1 Tax=Steinernema hermaphroditum TaxID=289476 RepID=A0AA39HPT1_9BILA|nr:hypothetical protein QR680_004780 [Steinernema hermaphroditum]
MDAKTGIASAALGVVVGVAIATLAATSLRKLRCNEKKKVKQPCASVQKPSPSTACSSFAEGKKCLLKDPTTKHEIRFVKKKALTPDTKVFRFKLPNSDEILGCPVGKYVIFTAIIDGQVRTRPYTPISQVTEKGGGIFSQYLDSLKKDDLVSINGPQGMFEYGGEGRVIAAVSGESSSTGQKMRETRYSCLGMVTGGSGITPMYQIIKAVLTNPKDTTKIVLLYTSRDDKNIILKRELDTFQERYDDRFTVHYVVNNAAKDSTLIEGPITEDLIKEKMPAAADDVAAFISGPPEMVNFVCVPGIDGAGYHQDHTYIFWYR